MIWYGYAGSGRRRLVCRRGGRGGVMDLQVLVFQTLVIRLLKMILYVLVYPDMIKNGRTPLDIEDIMRHAREFVRINTNLG